MRKRGFTLIELLVVIAIIALLLAILMPSLKAAKKIAQAAVCKANLHQWGLCYSLYTNDWNGNFPVYEPPNHSYMETLRNYYGDVNKMRTCPTAKKPSSVNPTTLQPLSYFGATFNSWQIDPSAGWLDDEDWGVGSFTENSWIRWTTTGSDNREWVKAASVRVSSMVPILLDGRWHDSHVTSNSVPTSAANENAFYSLSNWSSMRTYMMRRHKNGINGVMVDMSTVNIATEELWSYKWHRTFENKSGLDFSWLKENL